MAASRQRSPLRRPVRPQLERLEDRITPVAWAAAPPASVILPANAKAIVFNDVNDAVGKAAISPRSEVDYYRISAQVTGYYHISVSAPFSKLNPVLGFFDNTGFTLAYNNDIKPPGNRNSFLSVYLVEGEVCYFGVARNKGSPVGAYRWRVNGPLAPVAPGSPAHYLYLNFDGATITNEDLLRWAGTDWNKAARILDPEGDGITVNPLFDGRADREVIIGWIMDMVQSDLSPFGITVVRTTGLAVEGDGATTVFVGKATLPKGLFHVACDIDVGNDNPTDIAFVSEEDWGNAVATAVALADVILHEAGHTYGLFHVATGKQPETMGLRYSVPYRAGWVADSYFTNRAYKILPGHGPNRWQNSYNVMARTFGLVPGLAAPKVGLLADPGLANLAANPGRFLPCSCLLCRGNVAQSQEIDHGPTLPTAPPPTDQRPDPSAPPIPWARIAHDPAWAAALDTYHAAAADTPSIPLPAAVPDTTPAPAPRMVADPDAAAVPDFLAWQLPTLFA